MKKSYLAIALLSVVCAQADVHIASGDLLYWPSRGEPSTSDASPVPPPPSQTPAVYHSPSHRIDVSRGAHLYLRGDLLYWTAREEGLDYAVISDQPVTDVVSISGLNTYPIGDCYPQNGASVKTLAMDWQFGFRAGCGWNIPHGKWELSLLWTHFNHAKHASRHPDPLKKTLLVTQADPRQLLNNAESVKASWDLHYNVLDLSLGRSIGVSRWIALTPYLGVRGAWISQDFDVTYTNANSKRASGVQQAPSSTILPKVSLSQDQDLSAVGLRGGLKGNFAFCNSWSLYGDFSYSLLYSFFDVKSKEKLLGDVSVLDLKRVFREVESNAECSIGLMWGCYMWKRKIHLALNAGWELINWFNFNQFPRFADTAANGVFSSDQGDLSLSGWTFGARIDF
ncbi:MAG: hypothetical protein JSS61_00385 [Verrucomicrobia bacterium]|nr:hypothetical protein [Verrucomicrobiota bacterium]